MLVGRSEAETGAHAPGQVPDPDAALPAACIDEVEGEPVAASGKRGVPELAGVAGRFDFLSRPIHPEQPAPRLAGAVGERPLARYREPREADAIGPDLLGQGDRLAHRLESLRVEALRDEGLVPHEKEVAGGRVGDERLGRHERPGFLRVERSDPVDVLLGLPAARHVQKVLSVRQELRPGDLPFPCALHRA